MIIEFSIITGIPVDEILGRSRERTTVDARHLYWRLLREKRNWSISLIGKLNERTHASISHGIKKADELIAQKDKWMCETWEKVKSINS